MQEGLDKASGSFLLLLKKGHMHAYKAGWVLGLLIALHADNVCEFDPWLFGYTSFQQELFATDLSFILFL